MPCRRRRTHVRATALCAGRDNGATLRARCGSCCLQPVPSTTGAVAPGFGDRGSLSGEGWGSSPAACHCVRCRLSPFFLVVGLAHKLISVLVSESQNATPAVAPPPPRPSPQSACMQCSLWWCGTCEAKCWSHAMPGPLHAAQPATTRRHLRRAGPGFQRWWGC